MTPTRKDVEPTTSATDELRRLLDERGVKYWDMKTRGIWFGINADGSDHSYEAYDQTNSLIEIATFDLTPAQAIAATLGAGTCHAIISDNLTESEGMGDAWADCSECGHLLFVLTDPNSEPPNFCPNCGRRVSGGGPMTDTEKEALCARIDELCAENERLHAEQAHWELGNCPSCPNVVSLQEALEQNAKLREMVDYMTPIALYAASEQERDRMRELGVEL